MRQPAADVTPGDAELTPLAARALRHFADPRRHCAIFAMQPLCISPCIAADFVFS